MDEFSEDTFAPQHMLNLNFQSSQYTGIKESGPLDSFARAPVTDTTLQVAQTTEMDGLTVLET